jgi:hypothetical protein
MGDITLAQAQVLVETAMKKATEIDTLMNIAVVDAWWQPQGLCPNGWRLAGQHRYLL